MTMPRATVRLQLHAGFSLQDACAQVSYYAGLGISHFYTSPVSRARPGSMHGYDVIDHSVVSPELGGEAGLRELAGRLRAHGMGLLLDIVPNHMAVHAGNAWWWDILRHGERSAYATWLDIDWRPPDSSLTGKVLAPFLADAYGPTLASGGIELVFDESARSFQIEACGARYPVAPESLSMDALDTREILALHDNSLVQGQQRLHELLERQHYRLAWWRCAAESINWRRFFEISELIGVRVEQQAVFDAVHALPLRLFAEGLIDGLRIDHVDGLADPAAYCRQLRQALAQRVGQRPGVLSGDQPWLVVEKILADGETLDDSWSVDGTSGYDFMDQAAAVLHDPAGEPALSVQWQAVAQDARPVGCFVRDARRLMLRRHFVAERESLLHVLSRLARTSVYTRDWTPAAIARVLDELLAAFPVYRSYASASGRNDADAERFAQLVLTVRGRLDREKGSERLLLDILDIWLGGSPIASAEGSGTAVHDLQSEAIRRFQQLTPPLAAKSLEDTVFYRYGRLLSRNEVGSDPAVLAISPEAFHQRNLWRASCAPRSMLATATHDHKRGEDVRARLAVLSEIPRQWERASQRWLRWPDSGAVPTDAVQAGERYMLFQTLAGSWPLGLAADDSAGMGHYVERLAQWQTKALREAKMHSNWFEPDLDYEQDSVEFIQGLVPGGRAHALARDIERFALEIAPAGAVNSLAQTLLRVSSPGVPDLYQGTDFWDFSLVDPDNRRDVDYPARRTALDALDSDAGIPALVDDWKSGRLKQAVLARSLALRRDFPNVFAFGDYFGLPVLGPQSKHVLAFLRTWQDKHVFVLVPRLCFSGVAMAGSRGLPLIDPLFWGDTGVVLPRRYIGASLQDVLGGCPRQCAADGTLRLADVFADLPLALLMAD